ncbi:MAG: hypothetical protein RLZZ623_1038 [Actinomycetota bacterium]|jgi:enoyl-CoA hydratase/carnithine racemase
MNSPTLLRELDEHGVLLLTFNRPERNNGWILELEEAYFESLLEAAADPAVRVVVVTGAGRTFCPGLDMHALEASSNGVRLSDQPRRSMLMARQFPKPLIAAVNGACAGIGFIQAACADMRFAADTAKFTTAFARRGLPAENGLSWLLQRLVGTGVAADLLLSARVVLAPEALSLRLVERVFPAHSLLAETMAYARDVAANTSTEATIMIKRQLADDHDRTLDDSRRASLQLMAAMGAHPDFREGVQSFIDKRSPSFVGVSAEMPETREG